MAGLQPSGPGDMEYDSWITALKRGVNRDKAWGEGKGAELRFEGSKFQICPGNGNAMRRKGFDKVRDKVFDKV
jgi:hypothetical protein